MERKTYIQTTRGKIELILGNQYKGMGYSGAGDGVTIYGTLVNYDRRLDDATIKDNKGDEYAVIPTTLHALEETIIEQS